MISRSSGICAASGRQLQPGEFYIAALVEREGDEGLERLDYASDAWESGQRPRLPMRLFGFWRARFETEETRRQPLIDNESLLDLFGQLEESNDPARLSFRYILALLLVRKKLLRLDGVQRAGGRSRLMLRAAGTADGPIHEVLDPGMDEGQIADAVEQLGTVMAL